MKKLLSVLLTVVLLISAVPFGTVAASATTQVTDGYYTYTVNNGEATITDVDSSISGDITIPSTLGGYTVTVIGEDAFRYCENITSVMVPDSVTNIGDCAFLYCEGLTSIALSDSVTHIGSKAFSYCTSLISITIPESVISMGEDVFSCCFNLANVTIGDGITNIGKNVFYHCNSLTSITIPNSVTSIGYNAFYACNAITSITIPDSVKTIDDHAFFSCTGLREVIIGSNVESIHENAFNSCGSLSSFFVKSDNKYFSSDESGVLFNKDKTTLLQYPVGKTDTEYVIPDSVICIGENSFNYRDNLTSLIIPDSVTYICNNAFSNCRNLTNVKIGAGVTYIGDMAFHFTGLKNITIPDNVTTIGKGAFYQCLSLENIVIGSGVTSMGSGAFQGCTKITDITIKNGVTTIGEGAFSGCEGITGITIPDSVVNIGSSAFFGCKGITEITIPDTITKISDNLFHNCDNLISVSIPNSVTIIGESAFLGCDNLKNITIPDSVISIGQYAFSRCDSLESIHIPDNVTSVGLGAFSLCKSLNNITISDNVTGIEYGAFDSSAYYDNAENWVNNVLYISNHLIDTKQSLSGECIIKEGTKTIINEAFSGRRNLTSVVIPDGVTYIGDSAFSDCRSLTGIFLPDSVTHIGDEAFFCCVNLAYVFWPESLTSVGKYAFMNCENMVVCGYEDTYAEQMAYEMDTDFYIVFDNVDQDGNNVWENVSVNKTGLYDAFVVLAEVTDNGSYDNNTPQFAIYDKNGDFVYYDLTKGGYPLVKGEEYTIVSHNYILAYRFEKKANTIFPDTVSGAWYNDAVAYVAGRGLMSGYGSNGYFGTADGIQRQDFLVILARLDGVDLTTYGNQKSSFPDVPEGSYYEAAVNWGYEKGIVTGYQNGKFGVGDKITREQLVTFLYRYANYKGLDTSYTTAEKNKVENTYTDYKNITNYAQDPIIWAVTNGVIGGKTDTTIVPGGNALRCEVAKIMHNIFLNDLF